MSHNFDDSLDGAAGDYCVYATCEYCGETTPHMPVSYHYDDETGVSEEELQCQICDCLHIRYDG